jgi:YD repeat-containing protein
MRPAQWSYSISSPAHIRSNAADGPFQTFTETRVGGRTDVYEYFGFGRVATMTNGSGNAWRVGLQNSVARDASSAQHGTEVETFVWDSGKSVSRSTYSAPTYNTCITPSRIEDGSVHAPVLTRQTLQRGSSKYESLLYNYNEFGEPGKLSETGEAIRQTTYTYDHDFQNYQVTGRTSSEVVCRARECYSNSRTFNGMAKQLDSQILKGIKTTFTYYQTGELKTVTNSVGKTMTLSGYAQGFGLPTQIAFDRAYSTTRTAFWDGSLKSETNGRGDVTAYTYDRAGRLATITPPSGNDNYTYCFHLVPASGTSPAYEDSYSVRRSTSTVNCSATTAASGEYWETTTFDGVGRVVGQSNSLGEKHSREYDDFGRLVFDSYPFSASVGEVGERYDYDPLDRQRMIQRRFLPSAHLPLAGQCATPSACQITISFDDGHCRTSTVDRAAGDSTITKSCFESFADVSAEQLISIDDAGHNHWSYTYDVAGNLKDFVAPKPSQRRRAIASR